MLADATHLCIYINTEIINHLSQHFINISGNTHTHPWVINDQKMQVLSKRLILIESYQNIGRRDRQHKTQQTPDTNRSSIAESHEVEIGGIFRFSPPLTQDV